MITFLIHFFFLIQSLPQIKQAFCSGGQLTPLENIKRNTSISRTWKKKEVFKFVNVKIGVFQCISMLFCVLSVEYIKSHCWFLQSPKNSYCNNRMWLELFLGWPHPRSRTPKGSSQIKQPSWAVTSGHYYRTSPHVVFVPSPDRLRSFSGTEFCTGCLSLSCRTLNHAWTLAVHLAEAACASLASGISTKMCHRSSPKLSLIVCPAASHPAWPWRCILLEKEKSPTMSQGTNPANIL